MNMMTDPGSDSFLPTRRSLLTRLRDCDDQAGWREFFNTYWRIIYNVARKSGLADAEAQDVVQSTFIYLARRMPNFRYDASLNGYIFNLGTKGYSTGTYNLNFTAGADPATHSAAFAVK